MSCLEMQYRDAKNFLINEGYTEEELNELCDEQGCDIMFLYDTAIQKYN